jgi:hypothetical protein
MSHTDHPDVALPRAVYRYQVKIADEQIITMPADARILHVARRDPGDAVDMWALVDPQAPPQDRYFRVAGTGHPVVDADMLTYIGTVQLHRGALVFHVFEVRDH